jgi:hypothetical protein
MRRFLRLKRGDLGVGVERLRMERGLAGTVALLSLSRKLLRGRGCGGCMLG